MRSTQPACMFCFGILIAWCSLASAQNIPGDPEARAAAIVAGKAMAQYGLAATGPDIQLPVADPDHPVTNTPSPECDCGICQTVFGHTGTAGSLPGQTGFLRENDEGLAGQREHLATELTEYITRQPRDPEHIREIIAMCLDTAAQDAHTAALDASGAIHVTTPDPPDWREIEYELAKTRRMILATQDDVQLMSQSLQFLARHLKQTANAPAEDAIAWYSRETAAAPAVVNELDTIRRLQDQVRELEQQLVEVERSAPARFAPQSRAEQRLAVSWPADGQLRPANWEREPLRPVAQNETPLKPAVSPETRELVWRHYYVGDLISPPVANTTFRLMQHIKSSIDPDSWRPESIQIASPSVSLVVLQTRENHARLEQLLTDMGATMFR